MDEITARKHPWKVGDIVLYSSSPGHAFGAVVQMSPWELASGHRVARLEGLGPEYKAYTQRDRSTVPAASCGSLRPAPTEFVSGRWQLAGGAEPDAIIAYTTAPSPETGHVGWCWWARGRMGDAPSYEQARAAAKEAIDG